MLQDYYLYFLQDFYRYLKKIHQHNRHDYLHREYDKQQLYLYLWDIFFSEDMTFLKLSVSALDAKYFPLVSLQTIPEYSISLHRDLFCVSFKASNAASAVLSNLLGPIIRERTPQTPRTCSRSGIIPSLQ